MGSLPAQVLRVVISQHLGSTWYLQSGIQDFQPQKACRRWDSALSPEHLKRARMVSGPHFLGFCILQCLKGESHWVGCKFEWDTALPPPSSSWGWNNRDSHVFPSCSGAATVLIVFSRTMPLNSESQSDGGGEVWRGVMRFERRGVLKLPRRWLLVSTNTTFLFERCRTKAQSQVTWGRSGFLPGPRLPFTENLGKK